MYRTFVEPFLTVSLLVAALRLVFSDAAYRMTSRNYTGLEIERPDKIVHRRMGMGFGYPLLGGAYALAERDHPEGVVVWPVYAAVALGLFLVVVLLWREAQPSAEH